jgi:peptidoglycan/xylan/chitin deacetylase (PgdA/CDA1 family)
MLAPAIGQVTVAVRRAFGELGGFQTIILHDVADSQLEHLGDFLDFVGREFGFIEHDEAERRLDRPITVRRRGGTLPCLVTVDDGFLSARRIGLEILPRYGVRGIFFVCPGLIDHRPDTASLVRHHVFRGNGPENIPALMSWSDLAQLQHAGHTIGAHGLMHQRLSTLSGDALETEIAGSGHRIEQQLGREPQWYAYAFGDIDSVSADALQIIRRHFRFCRTGLRGANGSTNPRGLVFAQEIDLKMPQSFHRAILMGGLDIAYFGARARIRRFARSAA